MSEENKNESVTAQEVKDSSAEKKSSTFQRVKPWYGYRNYRCMCCCTVFDF